MDKNFSLDQTRIDALKKQERLSEEAIKKLFERFKSKYLSQKIFEHNSDQLLEFFDGFMTVSRRNGYNIANYFDFEFWRKSAAEQNTFLGNAHLVKMWRVFQDRSSFRLLNDKSISNRLFADFIHRDWLDLKRCSPDEFKLFVSKHPRFFAKPARGQGGRGARIVSIDQKSDLEKIFADGRKEPLIVEEIINQHPALAEFCPDTLNTIRINTLLDPYGAVRIMTAAGRFGRVGRVVDNFHGGGSSVIIDPITGEIISDGLNMVHQRTAEHPDSKKVFRGFRYPHWDRVRATVMKMAKLVPTLRHVGWDIAINSNGEPEFVEGNEDPACDVQQAADSIGRLHLYKKFIDDAEKFERERLERLGRSINNINDFDGLYQMRDGRRDLRVRLALENLINGCKSLADVGCRENKFVKRLVPEGVEYHPIDWKKYDDETLACDFNAGIFPELKVDTVLSIYTAEYVELLPEFLENLCRAARRQVLMVCRPIDREIHKHWRWSHPFVADFTEKFLIDSIERNGFYLYRRIAYADNRSVILFDFRRV